MRLRGFDHREPTYRFVERWTITVRCFTTGAVTGELPPTFSHWPTEQRIEYLHMAKDRETLLKWALAAAGRERERDADRVSKEELAILIERLWRYEGK